MREFLVSVYPDRYASTSTIAAGLVCSFPGND
jgi:hypothetical protein